MDESNELYLSTPPGRLFRKAACPGAISMLAATLFSLVMSMFLNVLNYSLNIVLDFTFLVVLKLPVWSAALATCIPMMTSTIIGMVPFALRKFGLRFCHPVLSAALFKQIIASGSPSFLNTVSGRLVSIVMNMALLYMGGSSAVVIYGVMMYCGDIVQPLLMGVCDTDSSHRNTQHLLHNPDNFQTVGYKYSSVKTLFGFRRIFLRTILQVRILRMI